MDWTIREQVSKKKIMLFNVINLICIFLRIYKRILNYTRTDTEAPNKITDLVAYRKDGDSRVVFRWTPVATASTYTATI